MWFATSMARLHDDCSSHSWFNAPIGLIFPYKSMISQAERKHDISTYVLLVRDRPLLPSQGNSSGLLTAWAGSAIHLMVRGGCLWQPPRTIKTFLRTAASREDARREATGRVISPEIDRFS